MIHYYVLLRPCLVITQNFFIMSHRIFRHMYKVLNIEKKIVTQIACKLQEESFKPNCTMI